MENVRPPEPETRPAGDTFAADDPARVVARERALPCKLTNRVRARAEATASRLSASRPTRPWIDVPWSTVEREFEYGGGLIAGGLAYRFFLWMLPLGLVVAAALGFWYDADREGLDWSANRFGLSSAIVGTVARAVAESSHNGVYLLLVGIFLLVWFSLGAVRALYLASSLAWSVRPRKPSRLLPAILAFNGTYIGLIVLVGFMSWARAAFEWIGVVSVVLAFTMHATIIALGLRALPNRDRRLQTHLPGAAVAALGLQLLHLAVIWYFAPKLGRSSDLYGSLGAAAVVLVWLYLASRLITGSMFLNALLWERDNVHRARWTSSEAQHEGHRPPPGDSSDRSGNSPAPAASRPAGSSDVRRTTASTDGRS